MPAMSCDRNGAAVTSSSSPVPAWNSARMWATGKPHPLAWLPGWPKWACNAGVSGMENDEPSTRKVRWPRQRPIASVSGIRARTISRRTARKTARGSRARAWQKAEAVKARPASKRDVGQGGVAVEDLDEEPVDDGRRGQEAGVTPGVSGGAAGGEDEVVAEPGGEVLSQGVEGGRNPAMHRGASCAMVVGEKTHGARRPRSSQVPGPPWFSGLNAIQLRPRFRLLTSRGHPNRPANATAVLGNGDRKRCIIA